jgi:predicted RNA-binding Zn-ribbon protein involved in translation (DUF1610 family)
MTGLKSGICPVCGSSEVFCDGNTKVRNHVYSRSIILDSGLLMGKFAAVNTYMCTHCGYIERYATNPDDMRYVRANWQRVGGKAKRKNDE